MSPAQTMRLAAELLRADAKAGEESCMVGERKWACADCPGNCNERAESEKRYQVAASIDALADAYER